MSRENRRRTPSAVATTRPSAAPRQQGTTLAEGRQISWGWCAIGLLVGEVILLVVSNIALGVANAAFGNGGFQAADGGIVGVATFLSVLTGGYVAARGARRFGLYQGVVVGIGFIIIGALYQFGQEASVVHSSLATGTHTLIDLGPMSMGNLISGDLLALVGASIGGLLRRESRPLPS